jgi:ABC-type Fe3+-hydroxamate transport system substrate-binding protein
MSSMTEYTSVDEMIQALGYEDIADFIKKNAQRLGNEDNAKALVNSWQQSFIDGN